MYDIASVLELAKSQIGYHEGKDKSGWDNIQKYSSQLPGFAWSQGEPWCAVFVQWCLWQAAVDVPLGARSASCYESVTAYRKAGRFTEYPVIGAQIFYGPAGKSHTGLVTGFDNAHVFTVEGNTNTNGSAEGDGVYRKTRTRRDDYVFGYGIPFYPMDHAQSPDPMWSGRYLGR